MSETAVDCTSDRQCSRRLIRLAVLALSVIQSGAVVGCSATDVSPSLEATQVSPVSNSPKTLAVNPGDNVEFVYLITNRSRKAIRGVKADLNCQCQIVEGLPEHLDPGGTAKLRFWVRAPRFGTVVQQVGVFGDRVGTPLLVLTPSVTVPTVPPLLLYSPQDAVMTFIDGAGSDRTLSVTAIEAASSSPWLTGIKVSPPELMSSDRLEVKEFREQSRELVRRVYSFRCSTRQDVGTHSGVLQLTSARARTEPNEPISLHVRVLESVSFIPNPVRVACSPTGDVREGRMFVVRRIPRVPIAIGAFDDRVIDLSPVYDDNGEITEVKVKPKKQPIDRGDTTVYMRIEGQAERQVRVQFDDAET